MIAQTSEIIKLRMAAFISFSDAMNRAELVRLTNLEAVPTVIMSVAETMRRQVEWEAARPEFSPF